MFSNPLCQEVDGRLRVKGGGEGEGVGVYGEAGIVVGGGEAFRLTAHANVVVTAGDGFAEIAEVVG